MTIGWDMMTHPVVDPPPIKDYFALERCFLPKFHEKNRIVFNALVVCLYRFMITDEVPTYQVLGYDFSKDELSRLLQNRLLGTLITHFKVGKEIGFIAHAYWSHCYDYLEDLSSPSQSHIIQYVYLDYSVIHLDFCAYVIRRAFEYDFDNAVRDHNEYIKCCELVKEANTKKGFMKKIGLEDTVL